MQRPPRQALCLPPHRPWQVCLQQAQSTAGSDRRSTPRSPESFARTSPCGRNASAKSHQPVSRLRPAKGATNVASGSERARFSLWHSPKTSVFLLFSVYLHLPSVLSVSICPPLPSLFFAPFVFPPLLRGAQHALARQRPPHTHPKQKPPGPARTGRSSQSRSDRCSSCRATDVCHHTAAAINRG